MPGITYDRRVEFSAHGPKVIHVLIAPKPGGLYALKPVLSNNSLQGRERVSSMQRRVSQSATVAGINGDLFTWKEGLPSGMLMQDGVLHTSPNSSRSSIGIGADGTLRVERVAMFGTWQGTGQRRPVNGVNRAAGSVVLYTSAWGAATPAGTGTVEATLSAFPSPAPTTDLTGLVSQVKQNGGTPIPPNGAVLVARGAQAPRLAAEAPVGQAVTVRLTLRPDWNGVVDALGGGPLIVRNGRPVFRALEEFSPYQLSLRHPRTAVGQTRDGRIVMLAVDGRQPGYSVGMTNFELALALMRFGVVTAAALDGGGSTTIAYDGKVLNRPSDGKERSVAEALLVHYYGVHAPAELNGAVLSPNGDGVGEQLELRYKVVRPSTVTVNLLGPDRGARVRETLTRAPGTYRLSWPGRRPDGSLEQLGRWRWVVSAQDDTGRVSTVERAFSVNDTLGFLRLRPSLLRVGRGGARLVATVRLARPARVVLSIETKNGAVLRRITRSARAGVVSLSWNGRTARGGLVYTGSYVARVRSVNAAGTMELERTFAVQRPFRVPKRKPARPPSS